MASLKTFFVICSLLILGLGIVSSDTNSTVITTAATTTTTKTTPTPIPTKPSSPPATTKTAPPPATTKTAPPLITTKPPPTTAPSPPSTTTAPPITTVPPPPTTTEPPPTTAPSSPPTTTAPPITTKPPPPTTTEPPPTTAPQPPPTTTKPPPPKTTKPPPVTTKPVQPTLPPSPPTIIFSAKNTSTNATLLKIAVGVRLTGVGDVPKDALTAGSTTDKLMLAWSTNTLALGFKDSEGKWSLNTVTYTDGENNTAKAIGDALGKIKANDGNAYKCKATEKINLVTDAIGGKNYTVSLFDLTVQAYMDSTTDKFSTAESCEADKPNNVVPIAVGAALAALVIIVLIMYLIGRRKHQRGYQTV